MHRPAAFLAEEFERAFGVHFEPSDGKPEAERALLELQVGSFDLIVLARCMQILSPTFLDAAGTPIINIHHSFLPPSPAPTPALAPTSAASS